MTASMASETGIIPDLYFPEDDQELQTSSVEGQEGRGQGGKVQKKKPVDLTTEGFIPIHKLKLEDLPEPIRTEEHLRYIVDISKNVVKISNNGLSSKRPDDDEFKQKKQKTLCGSGFLSCVGTNNVTVTTNRHVLFNEDELYKSTFDAFYDYHFEDPNGEKASFKRSVRKHGKIFIEKLSKDDIIDAMYMTKDEMDARLRKNCPEVEMQGRYRKLMDHPHVAADPNTPPVVCLISHPLGQTKHVSFGELLDYNMHSRTVHHSAPSKPGSSGGRVLVFSKPLILEHIFHVGWEKGMRYARVRIMQIFSTDAVFDCVKPKLTTPTKQNNEIDITQEETASLESTYLAAFVPIFGAFLWHTQEKCSAARDTSTLKQCKTFQAPHDLKQSVRKHVQSLSQVAPSFSLHTSSNSDDASDLISLLETQGPCYCQSIVKMMERGVKLEDGTVTECYLSPNTAAAKMSRESDITWPWLNRSKSDFRNDDAVDKCILEECLEFCDEDIIPVILLLMIIKANAYVKNVYLQPCDASSITTDCSSESQWETVYMRTLHVSSCEQKTKKWSGERQDSPPQEKMKNETSSKAETEEEKHRFSADILSFLYFILQRYALLERKLPEDKLNVPYSRCVAVSEHAWQHELQVHPDTERGRGDNGGNWCQCGRPGIQEFKTGCLLVLRSVLSFGKHDDLETKLRDAGNTAPILRPMSAFSLFIEVNIMDKLRSHQILSKHLCPNLSQKSPADKSEEFSTDPLPHLPWGNFIFSFFDTFPRGRQSLMLYLASREAYVYNFCLLARHINKRLEMGYFAFPASVFGRPGNWPGNVTPPEVQRTAWRLIQDAIMASGFRPALLAALEKNTERREKLIDLYVDMKQLKWQGKIHPHLFEKYLAWSKGQMWNLEQLKFPFADTTHYFVWYATYLVCPRILEY